MTSMDRILAARALLASVTPLKKDCGKLCNAACCQADSDGQGGMVLFPGEEALYAHVAWAALQESDYIIENKRLRLLVCKGHCPREDRPLACRIFPLTPALAHDRLQVKLDVRAWPICPLMAYGREGLSKEFVRAVCTALSILTEDAQIRAYIRALTITLQTYESLLPDHAGM